MVVGDQLGPYAILAKIGEGGMGEVYRARDSSLGREVAIKILPEAWLANPDRRARFDREARVLASFSHPHIGAIYGIEDAGHALVLELVEGPTLAERLAERAATHGHAQGLPLPESLNIALQIADALEAAHDKGIVHRDLKPANVKITPDGVVKVLDFGLAKLASGGPSGSDLSHSPTFTIGGTEGGVVLGTAAYMSPEQARGQPVDKRSDVWAFGCVLYEMLTGRAPFARTTVSDILAAILEHEPDWAALPATVPPSVRRLLRRCLTKDVRQRLRDIGDARLEIGEAITAPPGADAERAGVPGRLGRSPLPWILALVATAAATALIVWNVRPRGPTGSTAAGSVARLVISTRPTDPLAVDQSTLAVSPDGRRIAYAAGRGSRQRILVRDIDQFDSIVLPGTEGGGSPFFSPDGRWLGFVANGRLKKVNFAGGSAESLTDIAQTSTAFAVAGWESDDTIFFTPSTGSGIWRVSASGGTPTAVTTLSETENIHRAPQLLPGGKALLFSATSSSTIQAYVQILATGERRPLVKGIGARYLPSGHLVYTQAGTLMAVPFDPVRLETTGTPVAVLSGVMQIASLRNSAANSFIPQVAMSDGGTLAYVPASPAIQQRSLVWVDHAGIEQPIGASRGAYFQPRLSPDGRRVAVTVGGEDHDDVWLYDLGRETWSRFTSGANSAFPLWTPDGQRLTYVSDKAGPDNMYWKPLDGSGPEQRLAVSDRANYCFSWTRDGTLAFVAPDPHTLQDVWLLRPGQKSEPTVFLQTPFGEGAPTFSPDGRWLAYVSNESGRNEIYVRAFPGPAEKLPISSDGGNEPVWSRDGRELFYRSRDALMAVEVSPGPTLSTGKPRRLFEKPYELTLALWPNYDVSPDGRRFIMVKTIDQEGAPAQINVVLNWYEDLKRLAPAPRTK